MDALFQNTDDARVKNRIVSTVEIASKCGYAISVDEIALLLPYEPEVANIQEIIQSDPNISISLSMEKELIVQKGYEHLFSERKFREDVSKRYLEIAKTFVDQLIRRSSYVKLMAVCGSVAYGSALRSDDIDLFLVTKKNRLWLSIFKALLFARAFSTKALIRGKKAEFCLSYAQDERHFEEEIMRHKSPLLAREFLSIHVLTGINYYSTLLARTNWIRNMFPRLRASKLIEQSKDEVSRTENEPQFKVNDVLNLFIYAVLRNYLSFKAFLRNMRYRKQHKMRDLFEAIITKGSCVYTSERYLELEKMYDQLLSIG